MASRSHRATQRADGLRLPPTITYESVPGRWGYWKATIDTDDGPISATRPSLHETRDALESQLRELRRNQVHKVRTRPTH
jgi:hypothetical protein